MRRPVAFFGSLPAVGPSTVGTGTPAFRANSAAASATGGYAVGRR
jgi:hypothetical protein